MMSYARDFSQSEMEKYFEWIIMSFVGMRIKKSLTLVPSLSTKALGNSEMTYFGIPVNNF